MNNGMVITATDAQYHADNIGADAPSFSRTIAALICNASPAHAKAAHPKLTNERVEKHTKAMDTGTAVHDLLLRGSLDGVVVVDAKDWRTNAAKAQRDAAHERGLTPLLTKDWERVVEIASSVREQLDLFEASPGLLVDGAAEQTIVWTDRGVLCRARLDWAHHTGSAIDDLKTVGRSSAPEAFAKTVFGSDFGYDLQAAMYSRGLQALKGDRSRPEFRFVVVEVDPPYAVSVVALSPDALALADHKLDYALDTWRRCLETDTWPGYPRRVCYADLPPWAEMQWMDRETRRALEVAA